MICVESCSTVFEHDGWGIVLFWFFVVIARR
jgi:hypothetical protein